MEIFENPSPIYFHPHSVINYTLVYYDRFPLIFTTFQVFYRVSQVI
jgi:hypothetical protein